MINALKSILVVEFNQQLIPREQRSIILNEIYQYVCREIGIYDNPEDAWERFNGVLSEKFSNIEEFIHELYENSSNNN